MAFKLRVDLAGQLTRQHIPIHLRLEPGFMSWAVSAAAKVDGMKRWTSSADRLGVQAMSAFRSG